MYEEISAGLMEPKRGSAFMSPAMRKQMLWMLAAHIRERLGGRTDGLRRYQKAVKG